MKKTKIPKGQTQKKFTQVKSSFPHNTSAGRARSDTTDGLVGMLSGFAGGLTHRRIHWTGATGSEQLAWRSLGVSRGPAAISTRR